MCTLEKSMNFPRSINWTGSNLHKVTKATDNTDRGPREDPAPKNCPRRIDVAIPKPSGS